MITAVDTSALLEILVNEPEGPAWLDLLIAARHEGPLIVCETVVAEIAPEFESVRALADALHRLGIRLECSTINEPRRVRPWRWRQKRHWPFKHTTVRGA
jgi:predicted nucleic acid-binding protein